MNKNEDWRQVVERVRLEENGSWSDAGKAIAEFFPELNLMQLVRRARTAMETKARNTPKEELSSARHKITYKENGDVVFEGIVEMLMGKPITPEAVLKAYNLESDKWSVVSFTSNAWQSQKRGGKKIVLWQVKIVVRPKADPGITFEDVERYFESKDFSAKINLPKVKADESGEVLEICIPDLHSGLLAWRAETGEDYDINIAKERFFKAISDIVERCKSHSFSKIIFVTLGDLLHTDNDAQTTTKGTFQQVDGRLAKIFDCTLDMIIDAVRILSGIAPVEVVYICGNHDRVLGYTLIKAAEKAFNNSKGVSFDVSPNPQKFRLIGKTLIGWTHGDMPKKNMYGWLQDRARKEFGDSKYAEIHSGHYHSEEVHEAAGVKIRYMPNLAAASYWEHQQGFPHTVKTVVCYRWNKDKGLRSIWYNNI